MQYCQNLKMGIRSLVLVFSIVLVSCNQKPQKDTNNVNTYKDSIITIFDFKFANNKISVDSLKAKSILNSYFKKKGFLIESELNMETFNPESKEYYGKKAIDFLEVRTINNQAAIVRYYNCEPFENGICVQPHYAIIANTNQGSKIIHEDFLPNNFIMDSLKDEEGTKYIYGYFYECPNKKRGQAYRIKIN